MTKEKQISYIKIEQGGLELEYNLGERKLTQVNNVWSKGMLNSIVVRNVTNLRIDKINNEWFNLEYYVNGVYTGLIGMFNNKDIKEVIYNEQW